MSLFRLPRGLFRVLLMGLYFIPLAGIHVLIDHELKWWNLVPRDFILMLGLVVSFLLISSILVTRSYWKTLGFTCIFLACWSGMALFNVIKNPGFWNATYLLSLMGAAIIFFVRLRVEMSRSYLAPNRRWYEGRLSLIPQIIVRAKSDEGSLDLCVNRLDREGGVFFLNKGRSEDLIQIGKLGALTQIELVFGDRVLNIGGRLVARFLEMGAIGFRFEQNDIEARKKLGDLIEEMKGLGYV